MSRYTGIDIILTEEIDVEKFLSELYLLCLSRVKIKVFKNIYDNISDENTEGSWGAWVNNLKVEMFLYYYFLDKNTKLSKYISIGQYGYEVQDFFLALIEEEKHFKELRKLYPCIYKFCFNREMYDNEIIGHKNIIDFLKTGNEKFIENYYLDY